jgi:hypothetical protein
VSYPNLKTSIKVLTTKIDVNKDTRIPIAKVTAKPLTDPLPK